LAALAEGITDDRKLIRSACIDALCCAILDKHAFAVPAGVLVDILADIISPAITVLGQCVAENIPDNYSDFGVTIGEQIIKDEQNTETNARNEESDLKQVEKILSALCEVFLNQIQKLASYPSFDKLWLRVLNVFGNLININEAKIPRDEAKLQQLAKQKLKTIISALLLGGIFEIREGLWHVTKETVGLFQHCEKLADDISILNTEELKIQ
jgi:hypothetical protein